MSVESVCVRKVGDCALKGDRTEDKGGLGPGIELCIELGIVWIRGADADVGRDEVEDSMGKGKDKPLVFS